MHRSLRPYILHAAGLERDLEVLENGMHLLSCSDPCRQFDVVRAALIAGGGYGRAVKSRGSGDVLVLTHSICLRLSVTLWWICLSLWNADQGLMTADSVTHRGPRSRHTR